GRALSARSHWAVAACAALWSALWSQSAFGHAPLAKRVELAPAGGSVALALPGFGVALRPDDATDFAYVCDALLTLPPSDLTPAMAYTGDTLLIGTLTGLRAVSLQ